MGRVAKVKGKGEKTAAVEGRITDMEKKSEQKGGAKRQRRLC